MILGKQKEPRELINSKHWIQNRYFYFLLKKIWKQETLTWIPLFGYLSFGIATSMMEKIQFDDRKKICFINPKRQLDNFKKITTQTIILFELFNFFKTNKKNSIKTIILFEPFWFLKEINDIQSRQLLFSN